MSTSDRLIIDPLQIRSPQPVHVFGEVEDCTADHAMIKGMRGDAQEGV
jgi:hypothetical protein